MGEVKGSMSVGPAGLVGREGELAELAAFLDMAGTNGAALLLTGDPGVGKTALLDATAELAVAKGVRVVCGSGVEYETDITSRGFISSSVRWRTSLVVCRVPRGRLLRSPSVSPPGPWGAGSPS